MRFNGVLCVWDQILVVLATKIFLVASETECWTKLFSDSHMFVVVFFLLFLFSMFLLHYFIYVPAGFSKVLVALILGGT